MSSLSFSLRHAWVRIMAEATHDESSGAFRRRIANPTATLVELLATWRERSSKEAAWHGSPDLFRRFGRRMLEMGAPYFALECAVEGLEVFPQDVPLRQIHGLACARSGALEQAQRILGELVEQQPGDEETLGTYAGTFKDLGLASQESSERRRRLMLAQKHYALAYERTEGNWTGINAATMATLLGQVETARMLAGKVREQCMNRLDSTTGDRYWLLATLGEADLNLGNWSEAEAWYRQAAEASEQRLGSRITTRKQARVLLRHLGRETHWIDRLLHVPKVAIFAGHMSDQPGRLRHRFPAALEERVREEIRARLSEEQALVGYSSAACGSDLLFHEVLLNMKGEPHVVLPFEREHFARESVDIIPGSRWRQRFDDVLAKAAEVFAVSSGPMERGGISYNYANRVLRGLAMQRARELETELVPLAVWDGRAGDGPGGTATIVKEWEAAGLHPRIIDLAAMLKQHCPELATANDALPKSNTPPADPKAKDDTLMRAMLFADAKGYSKLSDSQVRLFVQHCLGSIAKLLKDFPNRVLAKNTWGDAIYLVFESVREAGQFALELCDLLKTPAWREVGLPRELTLRVGVHAGPVYYCEDPIREAMTYTGTHVSHAARLEPVTPPGTVCASQQFAALAAIERVTEFTCDFMMKREWAKDYGTFPTFVVRRA
jgi:class 3 adenylate cyclase